MVGSTVETPGSRRTGWTAARAPRPWVVPYLRPTTPQSGEKPKHRQSGRKRRHPQRPAAPLRGIDERGLRPGRERRDRVLELDAHVATVLKPPLRLLFEAALQ